MSTVRAKCSGRLPSPPLAWTRASSRSTSAANSAILPRLAAAQTSTRAAGHQGRGLLGAHLLEHAEPALVPAAARIEIGAVREQQIEQRKVAPRDMHGRAVEGEQ